MGPQLIVKSGSACFGDSNDEKVRSFSHFTKQGIREYLLVDYAPVSRTVHVALKTLVKLLYHRVNQESPDRAYS